MAKKQAKSNSAANRNVSLMAPYYNRLVLGGIPPVAAAGIVGNMMAESSMNYKADNGKGHKGLLQNDAYIRSYHVKNYGDYSLDSQIQFILDGWHGNLKDSHLLGRFNDYRASVSDDLAQNATNFERFYERSGGLLENERRRFANSLSPLVKQSNPALFGKVPNYAQYFEDRANNFIENMNFIHPSLMQESPPSIMLNPQDLLASYAAPTVDPDTYNRVFNEAEIQELLVPQTPLMGAYDLLAKRLIEKRNLKIQEQQLREDPMANYSKWLQQFKFD